MHQRHPSRLRRLTRALVYAVCVAVPLALLAFLVRTKFGPLVRFDQRTIVAATDFTRAHPAFRRTATAWEAISQPWVVYAVIGVPACVLAWIRFHLKTRAVWALSTMATGWALSSLIKAAVGRARPEIRDPFAVHAGYSFPSGHAANNAIVLSVVLLLLHPILSPTAQRAALLIGAVWLLVTCLDRIYLGAHFVSDVIAGVLLGCGLSAASYAGYTGWSPPAPAELAEDLHHAATSKGSS